MSRILTVGATKPPVVALLQGKHGGLPLRQPAVLAGLLSSSSWETGCKPVLLFPIWRSV